MKRRDFLRSAGAAAMIPVLPLPATAVPAAAAPVNAMQVGWAALYARVNERVSPALLQKWLRVDQATADALLKELINRNIVQSSVTGGTIAVKPMYPKGNIPGAMNKAKDILSSAKEKFDLLTEDDPDAELPPTPEPDPTDDQARDLTPEAEHDETA